MLTKKALTLLLSSALAFTALGKVLFVAPGGNDKNAGSINHPLSTIQKAQELVSAGDTVYLRGGTYQMKESQIAQSHRIWSYITYLDKSGRANKPINYWAYGNEIPVFDYNNIKPSGKRVIAFMLTGSWIHIRGIELVGVQVTITRHTQSECFEIKGSNNILEQISMHDGMAIGVYIINGSNNLILNCDAYRNYDSFSENGKGGNTDGFGCHVSKGDTGNVFRGCRAWFNSDDGYDCINSDEPVLFDHCWAFYNGYTPDFISRADGNGFKAGGYGNGAFNHLPYSIPSHTVQFCLAVGNKQNGFYANHHLAGCNWYNNTAYKNKRNYNMLNRQGLTPSDYLKDVPGYSHRLYNNLGYLASNTELANIDTEKCSLSNNSFDNKITDDEFINLNEEQLTAARQANGNLPKIQFLHLSAKSLLIDKGKPIGFGYSGKAPDLGCFE